MASAEKTSDCLRVEEDEKLRRDLLVLFKNLRAQAISNLEYYQDISGANYERFQSSFRRLYEHLDRGIEPGVEYLLRICHLYDYDSHTPANGYRSMVKVIHKCCIKILGLARYITVNRESFLFRSGHYSREIEAYVMTLGQLRACLYYLQKLVAFCREGELFPDEEVISEESDERETAMSLMMEFESLSQEIFYGRCLGFQFCDSMIKPLSTIILAMASYGDGYEQDSTLMKLASSILGGSRYILDPEQRAQKVINMTRNRDVHFCKSFWHIAETDLMHQLPLFVCPAVELDRVIIIPPQSFDMLKHDGSGHIKISPPCAHSGPGPVQTRLISYLLREGQEIWKAKPSPTKSPPDGKPPAPPRVHRKSPCLLIQCHGGGFVAQSSASHQSYLRGWARDLRIPILCIDYSLAPEQPFPRQLEEILYAVCWARKNAHLLGWTGARLGFCGDSAGGNLAVCVAMRLADMGLTPPDAVLSAYGVMVVNYAPSPSRMMTLMDPLLPMGIMASCLAAYSGMSKETMVTFPHEVQPANKSFFHSPGGTDATGGDTPSKTPTNANINDNQERQKLRHRSNLSNVSTRSCDSGYHDNTRHGNKIEYSSPEVSSPECNSAASMEVSSPENSMMSESTNSLEEKSPPDSPPVSSPSHQVDTRPDRSGMRLDLETSFGRKERMMKSPSVPVFHSLSEMYTPPPQADMSVGSPFRSPPAYAQIRHFAQSPVVQFRHLPIAKNPYMSPYLASDEILSKLPPLYLIGCHLDPFLDDSVMMARRLKSLGKTVHLEILEDLPHGFLSFTLVSRDARLASNVCMQRIRDMLNLDAIDWTEFDILDKDSFAEYNEESPMEQ